MRILLVEDDAELGSGVSASLKRDHYAVDWVTDGAAAATALSTAHYDLVILDLGLPRLGGLAVLRQLRSRHEAQKAVPVLITTAMDAVGDRVEGLDAGADDYLVKPFAFAELNARLQALSRRPPINGVKTVLQVGDLEMNLVRRTVTRAGKSIELQPQEFRLLEYLMRSDGRVVTRSMLLENVWDFHFDPQTSIVETHISRLRGKIDRGFGQDLLKTIRGAGYCLRAHD